MHVAGFNDASGARRAADRAAFAAAEPWLWPKGHSQPRQKELFPTPVPTVLRTSTHLQRTPVFPVYAVRHF